MIFPYLVVHDGVEYPAGADVPINRQIKELQSEETFATDSVEGKPAATHVLTKTEINRTSTSELKTLAAEYGIDDVENKSGSALKKELIEALGL